MLNFGLNIVEAQYTLLPNTDPTSILFSNFDLIFTVLFTVELVVNLFSNLVKAFIRDPWNFFDLTVVAVSLLSLGMTDMPAAGPMRLLRCFRVFRLFKRVKALRQLIVALGSSIPPMLNAFALVCLIISIYSLMGTTFFSKVMPDQFGDFFSTLFTMFQVMTADAWSNIARDMFISTGNPPAVAAFCVSFQVISSLVLLNVVIAVLLDEFHKAAEQNEKESGGGNTRERESPLDRIAASVAGYRDRRDLDSRIKELFSHVVAIGKPGYRGRRPLSQQLDSEELSLGFRRLGFLPPIIFTPKEWSEMVVRPGLTSETDIARGIGGETLGFDGFSMLIRQSLWRRTLRLLNTTADGDCKEWDTDSVSLAMQAIKGVLIDESLADASSVLAAGQSHTASPEEDPRSHTELKVLMAGLDELARRIDSLERLLPEQPGLESACRPARSADARLPKCSQGNGSPPLPNGCDAPSSMSPLGTDREAAAQGPGDSADEERDLNPADTAGIGSRAAAGAAALRQRLSEKLSGGSRGRWAASHEAERRRRKTEASPAAAANGEGDEAQLGPSAQDRARERLRQGLGSSALDLLSAHVGAGDWSRLDGPSTLLTPVAARRPSSEGTGRVAGLLGGLSSWGTALLLRRTSGRAPADMSQRAGRP